MRTFIAVSLIVLAALTLAIVSCDSGSSPAPSPSGKLQIMFDNVVGSSDLTLINATYLNSFGESFTVSRFNYFVSNLKLHKKDGSDYEVPQDSSYFLIEEDRPSSHTITLSNVPIGEYTGLSFLIGVDSLRSLSDISKRTGVLDPGLTTHDPMYWEWNSGYIFMKLEGSSAAAPDTQNNLFLYHIGGFGGGYNGKTTINNLRSATLQFGSESANVQIDNTPILQLKTNVLSVFNGTTPLSIAEHSSVMFETFSSTIADNYAQMFSFDGLQTHE